VSLLEGIIAHARRRVERLKREVPAEKLRAAPLYARPPRGLAGLLVPMGARRVAEVRFASPECGFRVPRGQATAEEAARWARAGVKGGAQAVSVMTERNFHAGDWSHVTAVRAALPEVCLIARDIVIDPYQLELARAHGADAVTLWGAVTGAHTAAMADAARVRGLGVVIEALNAAQLETARDARAEAVLALARDLDAAAVDPRAARLVLARARGLTVFVEAASSEVLTASPGVDVWAAADLG
jgi:indole-3-glycerol phosphate synthase